MKASQTQPAPAAEWVPISKLTPWLKNPRVNDHAVAQVAKSIQSYGFGSPLVARKENGEVIAGHTRLKAVQALPALWAQATPEAQSKWHPEAIRMATGSAPAIPVRYVDLGPDEAHALAIADNRVGELAYWDPQLLPEVLADISKTVSSIAEIFPPEGIKQALADAMASTVTVSEHERTINKERKPEERVDDLFGNLKPAKRNFKMHHGDNSSLISEMVEQNYFDAVVTDPPYLLGFMSQKWDKENGTAADPAFWKLVLHAMKPGAHLLAFGGTRTYHRVTCAIENAGFEIRDSLVWMYGSGFPKSIDVSHAVGSVAASDEQQWDGWGTGLKPAIEPIVLARKPLDGTVVENVKRWGTGALNIDSARVGSELRPLMVRTKTIIPARSMAGESTGSTPSGELTDLGRWPANVLLDEQAAKDVDAQSGNKVGVGVGGGGASRFFYVAKADEAEREAGLNGMPLKSAGELTRRQDGAQGLQSPRDGSGRIADGRANIHPTVKPIRLMRYLCELVTPPGGIVFDPFAGSGTTGIGAMLGGFDFEGIEQSAEYHEIANKRLQWWREQIQLRLIKSNNVT